MGMTVMIGDILLKPIPQTGFIPAIQVEKFLQIAGGNPGRIRHRLDTFAGQVGQLTADVSPLFARAPAY
jgi:hypothetical protein